MTEEKNETMTKYNFYTLRIKNTEEVKYVGCTTKSVEHRFDHHVWTVHNTANDHFFIDLYVQWREIGIHNVYVHDEECSGEFATLEEAHRVEQSLIEKYNTYENGWNAYRALEDPGASKQITRDSMIRGGHYYFNKIRSRLRRQHIADAKLLVELDSTTDDNESARLQALIATNSAKIAMNTAELTYLKAKRKVGKLKAKEARLEFEISEVEKYIANY